MINQLIKLINKAKSIILNDNGIYYINGPETLPPPLDIKQEYEALKRLENNDPEAKKLLVEHNLRLVVYIAKKFENTGVGLEDLISIGTIGLIKSINTFNPNKNIKLATYSSRCIENEILMYIRKTNSRRCEISIDEPINIDWDGNELLLSDVLGTDGDSVYSDLENDEDRKIVKKAISELNERDKTIITMRFGLETGKEKTQKEVAELLGISQSYISRLEKRIIAKLKKEIGNTV